MTVSLTCFLGDLLNIKNDATESSCTRVVIVDDNAKLSEVNRMKNSMCFANASTCHHLSNRWSSQPSLTSTSKLIPSPVACRRSSCTSLPVNNTRGPNATWDHDVQVVRPKGAALVGPNNVLSSKPIYSAKSGMQSSVSELNAPRVPERSTSPRSLKPQLDRHNMSKKPANRTSLQTALGDMAPLILSHDSGKKCRKNLKPLTQSQIEHKVSKEGRVSSSTTLSSRSSILITSH